MPIDTLLVYILIAGVVFLTAEAFRLNSRLKKVLLGKTGSDLEESINTLMKGMENLDGRATEIENYIIKMEERLKQSIQHVRVVRFNPFPDQGGNQSFAICFLDEQGNGAVISSLYSRDKVSVYAKPIIKYASEFELSGEEKQAIDKVR
ncbi:MAG: DUF4446 family protein [Candidatus Vogelbacteria bacterium]|nr:DUF4446 family protein [Candidatus Vogelbacteria bacterium]